MKVAYITMAFPVPSETFACNDVRALVAAGISISVHSLRAAHPLAEQLIQERHLQSIEITHSTNSTLLQGAKIAIQKPELLLSLLGFILSCHWRNPVHLLKSLVLVPRVLEIYNAIECMKPDILHLFWGHFPSLVAHLVQEQLPKVVTSIFLGAYDLEMNYGGSSQIARRAAIVWTHSQTNVAKIVSMGVPSNQIKVVYRGIDVQRLTKLVEGRHKIPKRLVSAGRLTARKGMFDVLNVFLEVIKIYPDATLTFLGNGPAKPQLEAVVKNRGLEKVVSFLGHVSHEKVIGEMARSEIFVFLSKGKGERLPNVVKEAMLSGCVCIVSGTTGMEELLPSKEYGFIVPINDNQSAIRYIRQVFDDPEMARSIAIKAKRRVCENFDIRETMKVYFNTWSELIAQASQSSTIASNEQVHRS